MYHKKDPECLEDKSKEEITYICWAGGRGELCLAKPLGCDRVLMYGVQTFLSWQWGVVEGFYTRKP